MGLFAGFKAYVASTFPQCVVPNDDIGERGGAVLDVMCALHAFKQVDGEMAPAQRLADSLWFSVYDAESCAFCFDVADNTPAAKAVCWQDRPEPAVVVTAESILAGLADNKLDHYDAIISTRDARSALCRWLQRELIRRFRKCGAMPVKHLYFFGSDGAPVYVHWEEQADGEEDVVVEPRHDLHKPLHGEADVSCVFAAHVLRKEYSPRLSS